MSFREEYGKLKNSWNKITGGPMGYVIYAVLGIFFAYLFYFGFGLILHTDLPFVAVVSGSMDHGENDNGTPCQQFSSYTESFDNWWSLCGSSYARFQITKEVFLSFSFHDGFKVGDMPVVEGSDSYKVGDIVVYSVLGEPAPIIHRIVEVNSDGTYQTRGDHNSGQNPYELKVDARQVHGKVIFIFPKIGYLKVILTRIFGV